MHVDLYLPKSDIVSHKLVPFQPVILNDNHVAVIGASKSDYSTMPRGSLWRFLLSNSDKLSISKVKTIFDAHSIEILINHQNMNSITWFLLLRLQSCYVVSGATERFKTMGCEVIVNFHTVFSLNGMETHEDVLTSQWLLDHPYTFNNDHFNSEEQMELSSLSFSKAGSDKIVYKVSSKTKLKIIPIGGVPSSLALKSPDFGSKSFPIGLESTWNSTVEFVRQFSLSLEFLSKIGEPTGLLLYGLQGCGKSRILETLSSGNMMSGDVPSTVVKHQTWYKRLHFQTLSFDRFSTSESEANVASFRKYITSMLTDIPKSAGGIVLSLPNLDAWPTLVRDPDTPQVEDLHEQDSANRNFGLYSFLFSTLKLVCSTMPVCVLATSTESTNIFKHRDLRNLFYRKLLVSLPNGEQRYRLLRQEIDLFLPGYSKSFSSYDIDRLRQLAACLHGYSLTDISRLLRASYAAAADDCSRLDLKCENGNLHPLPTIYQIVEKLESERTHYRPANLCAEISVFPPMRWSDIGGYSEIKHLFTSTIQRRLLEAADLTSEAARINQSLGLHVPRGILLHGPPGCSKTLFVRALATECNLPLVAVQASRIFGRYVGDSERNMQRILVHARACSPAILFIDEIDLLLPSRNFSESGASEHVLGEVLTVMDGVEGQCGQLLLIAATNRLENLDPALRRAGRFDMTIHVPPPDAEARKAILQLELSKRSASACALDSDWLGDFAKSYLEGYTGAEIVGVVQVAAELTRDSQCIKIDREHLLLACKRLPPTTLEQYSTYQRRETSQEPSSSPSINSSHLSNQSCFVVSLIIVVLAVGLQLVTHLGLKILT